jgi:hypothetical protein
MRLKTICLTICVLCAYHLTYSQTINIDSCGLNSDPILNQYEITFVDSFLFAPFETKKSGTIDPKRGFDFNNKKIAFFSCTVESNTKGNGILLKKDFFALVKPAARGHAGIGLVPFTESEKKEAKGFDAVIIIDCPYSNIKNKDLIAQLVKKYE